jgi:AcrR family transcriptional regulator
MTETKQRKPGRPRSAQAEQAILDATLQLLAEEGVQGMSVEGVAARAGVGKTTIYRRWASKDLLIFDAISRIKLPIAAFDTGHFRTDIESYLHSLAPILDDPLVRSVSLRIAGEATSRPAWLAAYFAVAFRPNADALQRMIERARARGELRPEYDALLIMEVIGGPLFYHMLVSHLMEDVPPFSVDQFCELLWEGLKPFRAPEQDGAPS